MPTTSPDVEELPTRWELFKKYTNANPLTFYPVPIILTVAMSRFFVEDLLVYSLLNMITYAALGVQWIGLVRSRRKMKNEHTAFDEKQLLKMIELNKMGSSLSIPGFNNVMFLSPYKPQFFRRLWNKLTKRRMLALYSFGEGKSTSFTKYIVSEKEWFYLQLRDCIDTMDPELLHIGREYLKDNKRVATVL